MNQIDFISNNLKKDILAAVASGKCTSVEDVVKLFEEVTIDQAVALFNDSNFLAQIANYSKANARLHFHTKGLRRVKRIAVKGDDKSAMTAIKLLGEYTGEIAKKTGDVNVQVSLENHIRQEEYREREESIPVDFVNTTSQFKRLTKGTAIAVDEFEIEDATADDFQIVSNNLKEATDKVYADVTQKFFDVE